MRLLIFSMPAVALVAIMSVSLQHSMSDKKAWEKESALPEATRIFLETRDHQFYTKRQVSALSLVKKTARFRSESLNG